MLLSVGIQSLSGYTGFRYSCSVPGLIHYLFGALIASDRLSAMPTVPHLFGGDTQGTHGTLHGGRARMLDQSSREIVHRLREQGWTIAQIANLLQQEESTILQVAREVPTPGVSQHETARKDLVAAATVQVRMSPDARRLQIWLPADALSIPTEGLAAQITAACADQGIPAACSAELLALRMRTWVYGTWLTLLESDPPTPPTPDRIEVVTPLRLAARRTRGDLHLVQQGTVLARRHPGQPGLPGRDLLGRTVAPQPQRITPLPQGEQTQVSTDGLLLLATVAGEVVLRNLRIHVLPLSTHEGDVSAASGVIRARAGPPGYRFGDRARHDPGGVRCAYHGTGAIVTAQQYPREYQGGGTNYWYGSRAKHYPRRDRHHVWTRLSCSAGGPGRPDGGRRDPLQSTRGWW